MAPPNCRPSPSVVNGSHLVVFYPPTPSCDLTARRPFSNVFFNYTTQHRHLQHTHTYLYERMQILPL